MKNICSLKIFSVAWVRGSLPESVTLKDLPDRNKKWWLVPCISHLNRIVAFRGILAHLLGDSLAPVLIPYKKHQNDCLSIGVPRFRLQTGMHVAGGKKFMVKNA